MALLCLACSCASDGGSSANNHLTLRLDGDNFQNLVWTADPSSVFGAFHPQGYNDAILISGSVGSGLSQQAFNLNLYRTPVPGTGTYIFSNTTEAIYPVDKNVVQLANLTPVHYLYGGVGGVYNLTVTVTRASADPAEVECTFYGLIYGVNADLLQITEGDFYYHE